MRKLRLREIKWCWLPLFIRSQRCILPFIPRCLLQDVSLAMSKTTCQWFKTCPTKVNNSRNICWVSSTYWVSAIFLGSKITADGDCSSEVKRCFTPWKESCDKPRQHFKKQRYYFADKGLYNQSYGFSSGHVWMWELDYKESWAPKNWCFWTVVLEKTLESPLDCKKIQPVHSKGNQSWIFIGRTDAEAETPIFWPPDAKNWHIWKVPDAGKDWMQEEKGMTEDEMVGWHHWLNGHEFE